MAPKADKQTKPEAAAEKTAADKIEKVPEPDRVKHDAACKAVDAEMDKIRAQIKPLKEQIDSQSHGREEFTQKSNEIRNVIQKATEEIDRLKADKDRLFGERDAARRDEKERSAELKKKKALLGAASWEEVERKIQQLEWRQMSESMPLREEKKLLDEIKELKRQKPQFAKVAEMEASHRSGPSADAAGSTQDSLQAIGAQIKKHSDERNAARDQLSALRDSRTEQTSGVQHLVDERNKLNAKMDELRKKKDALWADFKEKQTAYRAYKDEVWKATKERRDAERAKRDEEYKQRQLARMEEKKLEMPHVGEIALLEQAIRWCKDLMPKDEVKAEVKQEAVQNIVEGSMMLVRKEARDEEFYFAPTKGKSLRKKGGGKAKVESIKHNAETFRQFEHVKVAAPMTVADLPNTVTELEKKKAEFEEKVEQWKKERAEEAEKIARGEKIEEEDTAAEEKA